VTEYTSKSRFVPLVIFNESLKFQPLANSKPLNGYVCALCFLPDHSQRVANQRVCGMPQTHEKFCVLNFRKSLTEILRHGCGTMRAAAVTWKNPISPDGRLAELACAGLPSARLEEHLGGDWGLPRYCPLSSLKACCPTHSLFFFNLRVFFKE